MAVEAATAGDIPARNDGRRRVAAFVELHLEVEARLGNSRLVELVEVEVIDHHGQLAAAESCVEKHRPPVRLRNGLHVDTYAVRSNAAQDRIHPATGMPAIRLG